MDKIKKIFRIDVISLFPKTFDSLGSLGVIGKAFSLGIAKLYTHNPRDFTEDPHRKVDDEPYGGGPGMLLKPEPVFNAFESIPQHGNRRTLMMTPQGKRISQADLKRFSEEYDQLIIICGHYEGFDERIRTIADEEISLGDFVLTGGEIPAMAIINGAVRLLPGTLGCAESLEDESHSDLLLEYPQYTRPSEFRGSSVPDVLKSGNHDAISDWRKEQMLLRTAKRRPDLYHLWLHKNNVNKQNIVNQLPRSLQEQILKEYSYLGDPWWD